jgi:hypothetical protein
MFDRHKSLHGGPGNRPGVTKKSGLPGEGQATAPDAAMA